MVLERSLVTRLVVLSIRRYVNCLVGQVSSMLTIESGMFGAIVDFSMSRWFVCWYLLQRSYRIVKRRRTMRFGIP